MLDLEGFKKSCSNEAYKALIKNKLFDNSFLKSFGFLVKVHSYKITLEGLPRGWAFVFSKDNISIFICRSIEDELPLIWVSCDNNTHYAQKSIEEIAEMLGFEKDLFRYEISSKIEELNFFKKILYKQQHKKNLKREFDKKIEDSGNFLLKNYDKVIRLVENFQNLEPITSRKSFR